MKKTIKIINTKKYGQAPTCEHPWPEEFIDENMNLELAWNDI